eukprot:5598800-Pyramimonas_sp.AAC.1
MDSVTKGLGFDGFYWSTLAKIMHTWRNSAVEIFRTWSGMFCGAAAARSGCIKAPPRPISGRWGSAS